MKVFGLWVLSMVLGTALMFLAFSSSSFSFPGMIFPGHGDAVMVTATSRKLKENSYNLSTEKKKRDGGIVNVEDYHHIDPVPSSKASIKYGPIEHGSPLMPYIPNPAPPTHPWPAGSP